jgi:hypothetical protein
MTVTILENLGATGTLINRLRYWLHGLFCRNRLCPSRNRATFCQKIIVLIQFENVNSVYLSLKQKKYVINFKETYSFTLCEKIKKYSKAE